MESISHLALASSVLSSIVGALVVCVLVFRYGFIIPAPGDSENGPSPTDVLITRVGHAVAGSCFVATAVLAVVALSLRPPPQAPSNGTASSAMPLAVANAPLATSTDETDLVALEGDVEDMKARLARAQSQLARLDEEVRKRAAGDAIVAEPKRAPRARDARASVRSGRRTPDRRSNAFLATVRDEWRAGRQRAAGLVSDVRAAFVRAEQSVVRHVGRDPQGRVSARD